MVKVKSKTAGSLFDRRTVKQVREWAIKWLTEGNSFTILMVTDITVGYMTTMHPMDTVEESMLGCRDFLNNIGTQVAEYTFVFNSELDDGNQLVFQMETQRNGMAAVQFVQRYRWNRFPGTSVRTFEPIGELTVTGECPPWLIDVRKLEDRVLDATERAEIADLVDLADSSADRASTTYH